MTASILDTKNDSNSQGSPNAPFIAKTKKPDEWKGLTSAMGTLVDEATVEATVEGISMRAMDPSHIALLDIFWPASTFEYYSCTSPIKMGLKVEDLSKIFKRSDKNDAVEVSMRDDGFLHVRLTDKYTREFKTRLIESSANSTPLPKLNFNAKVMMTVGLLDQAFKDIAVVSEYVSISSKAGAINLSGRGDSGEVAVDLYPSSLGMELIEVKEESRGTYSLDYLQKMVTALLPNGGSVTIEHTNKMPVRLEFRVANLGRIHFYLAPRVHE